MVHFNRFIVGWQAELPSFQSVFAEVSVPESNLRCILVAWYVCSFSGSTCSFTIQSVCQAFDCRRPPGLRYCFGTCVPWRKVVLRCSSRVS